MGGLVQTSEVRATMRRIPLAVLHERGEKRAVLYREDGRLELALEDRGRMTQLVTCQTAADAWRMADAWFDTPPRFTLDW